MFGDGKRQVKYIQKSEQLTYEDTGTYFVFIDDSGKEHKYRQHTSTAISCHVVKMPCGTNIVLSNDEIEELIPLLRRIVDGEEKPLNGVL